MSSLPPPYRAARADDALAMAELVVKEAWQNPGTHWVLLTKDL